MKTAGAAGIGSEGYDRRYEVSQIACWILDVPLLLIFVNLFVLKLISLVYFSYFTMFMRSSRPTIQITQVPVPSTFKRTRHLDCFSA